MINNQNLLNLVINTKKILYYLSKANKIVLELKVAITKIVKMTYTNYEIWICYLVIV